MKYFHKITFWKTFIDTQICKQLTFSILQNFLENFSFTSNMYKSQISKLNKIYRLKPLKRRLCHVLFHVVEIKICAALSINTNNKFSNIILFLF